MSFKPITLKNVDLVFGDATTSHQFKCQVKSLKFIPESTVIREKTACPTGVYTEVEDPTWNLEVGHLTGYDDAGTDTAALTDFLRANSGDLYPVAVRFASGTHQGGYKARVRLVPAEIGAAVGGMNTATVQLPVEGQPEKLTAPEAAENAPAVWS